MHLNYYFLRFLSEELRSKLLGLELAECYLQNRYECVLAFFGKEEEFFIKLNLYPEFTCLAFPSEFYKNKKGTYPLFKSLNGLKILDLVQHDNDRSFHLVFENEMSLMFKLYGSRSNLLLFFKNECVDLLNKNLAQDQELVLDATAKKMNVSWEQFVKEEGNLKKLFPAFDKEILTLLEEKQYATRPLEAQWARLSEVLTVLNRKKFFILETEKEINLSFFEHGKIIASTDSALEAANLFERYRGQQFYLSKEKQEALTVLNQKIKKTKSYLATVEQKKIALSQQTPYEEIGHILMANLHQIPRHISEVELFNFYTEQPIVIRLKKDLTPQKNAEQYYRKAKNQKLEVAQLDQTIAHKRQEKALAEAQVITLENFQELKSLRKYLKEQGLMQEKISKGKEQEELFRKFEIDDFEILVGKSAKNNDLLTQKYSYKEDLWLHARDVAGSHVLIKYKAGKIFPKQVIEKAAQLAAYYSKRKSDTLCPVIVTPKKYVRKPKGALEGQVLVEREEVLLVKPAAYDDL